MGNPKMSSCRDAKGNKQSPQKVQTAWDLQQGLIHLPVGEMLIFFLIVLQPGKLRRRTTTNNVFRKDIRHKREGFFFKEGWKKESVGLIPTGNVLLLPQEQDWEEPGELAVPSSPCCLSAQDLHRLLEENMVLCGLLSVKRQWH